MSHLYCEKVISARLLSGFITELIGHQCVSVHIGWWMIKKQEQAAEIFRWRAPPRG